MQRRGGLDGVHKGVLMKIGQEYICRKQKISWTAVQNIFGCYSKAQLKSAYYNIVSKEPGRKKRNTYWTRTDEAQLRYAHCLYGRNWREIKDKVLPGYSVSQIRQKWNYLRTIKAQQDALAQRVQEDASIRLTRQELRILQRYLTELKEDVERINAAYRSQLHSIQNDPLEAYYLRRTYGDSYQRAVDRIEAIERQLNPGAVQPPSEEEEWQ